MTCYHGLGGRLGALALTVGTGAALVHGCGTAAAGSDLAAAMFLADGATVSTAIDLLALTYDELSADPFVHQASLYHPSPSYVTAHGHYDQSGLQVYTAVLNSDPMVPSSGGGYVPADVYVVQEDSVSGDVSIFKLDMGATTEITGASFQVHVLYFERGFYPDIFNQDPHFVPDVGDNPIPGSEDPTGPVDPTDPGTGPGGIPLDELIVKLKDFLDEDRLGPYGWDTLLNNLETHGVVPLDVMVTLTEASGILMDPTLSAEEKETALGALAFDTVGGGLKDWGMEHGSPVVYLGGVLVQVWGDDFVAFREADWSSLPDALWHVVSDPSEAASQMANGLIDYLPDAFENILPI